MALKYANGGVVLYNEKFEDVPEHPYIDLVMADPPWSYAHRGCRGNADDQYEGLTFRRICELLHRAYEWSHCDSYMILWCTYPHVFDFAFAWKDFTDDLGAPSWVPKTGGSWHKLGTDPLLPKGLGVGFHQRGDAEPYFLWVKGSPKPNGSPISNALHTCQSFPTVHTDRTKHSRKPKSAVYPLIESFSGYDSTVLEPFAGDSANCALSCRQLGRNYVGMEPDEERFQAAVSHLRQRYLFEKRD